MNVRLLNRHDAGKLVRLRREALSRESHALAGTPQDALPRPRDKVLCPLCPVREAGFPVGAFAGGPMVGEAGFFRLEGRRERHKGRILGVQVTEAARGKGAARAMPTLLPALARGYAGLEQAESSVAAAQGAARNLYDSLGFGCRGMSNTP